MKLEIFSELRKLCLCEVGAKREEGVRRIRMRAETLGTVGAEP